MLSDTVQFNTVGKTERTRKNYEIYKLQWMIDHGFTLRNLIRELTVAQQESFGVPEPIEATFDR